MLSRANVEALLMCQRGGPILLVGAARVKHGDGGVEGGTMAAPPQRVRGCSWRISSFWTPARAACRVCKLHEQLGSDHQVTMINEWANCQFVPSSPWLAVGWRRRSTSAPAWNTRASTSSPSVASASTPRLIPTYRKCVLKLPCITGSVWIDAFCAVDACTLVQ